MNGNNFLFDDLHNSKLADDFDAVFRAPAARPSDPETSKAAAASVSRAQAQHVRSRVLAIFHACGAMTQAALVDRYRVRYGADASDSSIRTRCAELVDSHELVNTGRTERLPSGRTAVIWGRHRAE